MYLMSDLDQFSMSYLSYTKHNEATDNQGCGTLDYAMVENSAKDIDVNNVLFRPIGAAYYLQSGTKHMMYADDRRMIGEHYAIIEIKSNIETLVIADKRYANITMTILDCKVDTFEAGQLFESF